jgi:hypothetical protein
MEDFSLVDGVIVLSSAYPLLFVLAERRRQPATGMICTKDGVAVAVREDSQLLMSSISCVRKSTEGLVNLLSIYLGLWRQALSLEDLFLPTCRAGDTQMLRNTGPTWAWPFRELERF